ncbi:hypothetical protein M3689_05685 [Alkalihalophilus marmarensis]|uniref:hypothetical protein n=1 Tax=Alkalihalophilus marmarensis TaxID=521377 RepID=UPI00203EA955|nr:hypothetical protein [Alkalihalophilus marmarensis]MCM3488796.1 hypothetical protein [Alkalihalophilus marmarensis]
MAGSDIAKSSGLTLQLGRAAKKKTPNHQIEQSSIQQQAFLHASGYVLFTDSSRQSPPVSGLE